MASFCQSCGSQLEAGARSCAGCGNAVVEPSPGIAAPIPSPPPQPSGTRPPPQPWADRGLPDPRSVTDLSRWTVGAPGAYRIDAHVWLEKTNTWHLVARMSVTLTP